MSKARNEGMLGVYLLVSAALTVIIYQVVYWLAYKINWWLGAVGFDSQHFRFKILCIVVSFFLAAGIMALCIRIQSAPVNPSKGKGDQQ